MEKITQFFLILSSSIIIFLTIPARSANPSCKPDSCHATRGPKVRFPFRLKDRHPARCGYGPGFDLQCNSRNQTVLHLPQSGDFIVDYIDYKASVLFIDDPGFCLPSRAMNFSLAGSPFEATFLASYGILNCSGEGLTVTEDMPVGSFVVLSCLGTRNSTVMAVDMDFPARMVPPPCRRVANVSVPPWWTFTQFYWETTSPEEDFELRWSEPACGKCESRGGLCGFKDDSGLQIECSKPSGLPRGAKYAIIIGGGVPGLLCMIGLTCYGCSRIKISRQRRLRDNNMPLPTTITTFDPQFIVSNGLDMQTIESYPKVVLGQSRRLPSRSDVSCSICLSDYLPKDILKSIPECNHYFHATCIDEWLKLNGTCPLCRNSPETSSSVTRTSLTTTSSSSSSSSSPSSTQPDHH